MFTLRCYPSVPTLVTWVVSPTSGSTPYTYTATFTNKEYFDNVFYQLRVRGATSVGACPTTPGATNQVELADSLLASGTAVQTSNSVPSGSCRLQRLEVFDIKAGTVVQFLDVTINNV